MKKICAVCEKSIKTFESYKLRDGVICKNCFDKSSIKVEQRPKQSIEVWEVCVLCEMSEDEKKRHFEKQREEVARNSDIILNRIKNEPNIPKCPKCKSTSITADKKGFGVGKAVVGAAVAGPLGLVAGNIGSKKVRITCLNCGHQWMAGRN